MKLSNVMDLMNFTISTDFMNFTSQTVWWIYFFLWILNFGSGRATSVLRTKFSTWAHSIGTAAYFFQKGSCVFQRLISFEKFASFRNFSILFNLATHSSLLLIPCKEMIDCLFSIFLFPKTGKFFVVLQKTIEYKNWRVRPWNSVWNIDELSSKNVGHYSNH